MLINIINNYHFQHTIGTATGQYIYIKGVSSQNQVARLLSPVISVDAGSGARCEMIMHYHMLGDHIGKLAVYTRSGIGGIERQLFNRTREAGDYWERVRISISNEPDPFQVVIEGATGTGIFGDIALDDIVFTPGCKLNETGSLVSQTTPTTSTTSSLCRPGEFYCASTANCISSSLVCNFVFDCADQSDELNCGTCDFEHGPCGWFDKSDNKFIWSVQQAPSPYFGGPQYD